MCRRELQGSTAIEIEAEPRSLPGWVLGVVGAAVVVGVAAFALRDGGSAASPGPPPTAAGAPVELTPRRVEQKRAEPEPEPAKTPEEQLAEAERLEAEREHEIAEAQRAEVRTRMEEAEARRKLAEEASDKKRHARVSHDLENAGLAFARRNVNITMYSTSWCGACKQARAYMEANSIAFTDYDVEHDAAARAQAHRLNPRGSVPTISVDGDVMVGFSAGSLEHKIDDAARRRKGS
ncbi:MAG TPA: glutaredoxin family protein [Polyangiales bacterium]|nr:glutaredoxin family protein [Polyangiales bacterium]